MRFMNFRPSHAEIQDAAQRLPAGATLVVSELAWDDYERLLEEFTDRRGLRIRYDSGWLEIMSPSPRHEKCAAFIEDLVRAFAELQNLPLEKFGHTTWKMRALAKGIEADACYYVRNAHRVIGKEVFDLESDPSPDVAVEIDITAKSPKKLSIYAALSVSEVWRYDGRNLRMYTLRGTKYEEIAASQFLPGLTGTILAEFIETSRTRGQTAALKAFTQRLKSNC